MYWVYGIFNKKHNRIYIGQCEDLETRIKLHNDRIFTNSYTARYDGEWTLVYSESAKTRQESLKREKQLKSYQGRQFIKSFI